MGKEGKVIEFNVKFITPLLIGGAYPRKEADPAGLTGKALRGCWRFWFRAIVGGIVKDIDPQVLKYLEDQIFGAADIKTGAKFRLNIEKLNDLKQQEFELGFTRNRKNGESFNPTKCGYPQDSTYSLKIIPRGNMSKIERNILISTIWLWGNLGAIGNRSRRGFGSPVIFLNEKYNNPFAFKYGMHMINFPVEGNVFDSTEALELHLKKGLRLVGEIFKNYLHKNQEKIPNKIEINFIGKNTSSNSNYFILNNFGQILVGSFGYTNHKDATCAFHGKSNCRDMGWANSTGKMASPIIFRFHNVDQQNLKRFIPVAVWCKQENIVVPSHNNCALHYLKNMTINKRKVFVKYLNGDKL